jgi:GTP-binding protein LepA
MLYKARNGETYELNLIDTPGHVDFSYEVSRSLSACEGALLIIDAAQGVEAQTVANVHLAMKQNLTIIPVINKIELPHANVAMARQQLEDILAIPAETAVLASAKQGIGIEDILEAVVERIPPPNWTGTIRDFAISRTISKFVCIPEKAASKSTMCSQSPPSSLQRLA